MAFIRRTKASYFFLLLTFLVVLYLLKLLTEIHSIKSVDFSHFDNILGSTEYVVPNVVHFIHFDNEKISFINFICILSAYYNHRPNLIFIHTNMDLTGRYYHTLVSVIDLKLKIVQTSKPSHVFGQKLSSVQHSADVARIKIMMQYGGIMLDEDVFVVKSLNWYRHFELCLGWPQGQNMGSQVVIAHKQARFLPMWLSLYQQYRPSMWYYNAGEYPTHSLLEKMPELVHRVEREFGVENLSNELYSQEWSGWKERHTIHLLSRHQTYLTNTTNLANLTEENYQTCQCTFANMVSSILTEVKDENIVWSGEWLRLSDSSGDDGLRTKVEEFIKSSSQSLLHKHLSLEMFVQLEHARTPSGQGNLRDQIQSGLVNLDSSIGVYASDPDAYTTFHLLFTPIINDIHGNVGDELSQPPVHWGDPAEIGDFNRDSNRVVSTRIRIARSIEGFPFNSKMSIDDYLTLEQTAMEAFSSLTGSFSGTYHSLSSLSDFEKKQLREQHLLFGPCDRFLESAEACNHWPAGRGIFLNTDRTFVVWVGEEDHLRIISIQSGGNLGSVYSRLVAGVTALEEDGGLVWVRSPSLGFLTFCPSNLGTTIRASVHIKVENMRNEKLERWTKANGLEVRGTGGEHTETVGNIVDLSNSGRLGMTEFQVVDTMYKAIVKFINKDNFFVEH